jgi:NarL family two-component system response regulator LiaR
VNEPISIIIVDDHAVVRSGLRAYLSSSPEFLVIGESASGEEAIELTRQNLPDVVLMDLILPGIDGSKATCIIKKISPRTKIVVLTSSHDDELIFSAYKSGAHACILKDMKMDNLTGAIRRAVNDEVSLHPRMATQILSNLRTFENLGDHSPWSLTVSETEVLGLIAQGFSNRKTSEELQINENKVNRHLSNVLNKLHLIGRTQRALNELHPEGS